jgi:signal transduction histidine kinase
MHKESAPLPPWRQARILIVDDEAADTALLERILRKEGYDNIDSITNPCLVLARQAEFRPDLIVLDIRMPGLDGFQVLERLGEVRRDEFLPILITTGAADRTIRLQALEAGAQDLIAKPFDGAEVACRVRNLVQLRLMYEAQRASRLHVEKQVEERTATLHDALELLKQAERELSRRLEKSETAGRAKSAFVAEMSHELRTPLNAILGFSELLRDERFGPLGSPKYKDYAAVIHESGSYLLRIANDLLDLSKAEAGKLDVRLEQVDANEVVTATVRMLAGLAKHAGVDVRIDIPEDFPSLHTDEQRLGQVLVNIVTNALKFTPRGGFVTIQGRHNPVDGAALIVVSDTGVGIAPEDIPVALTPYGQVGQRNTGKHKGTGLGLPLTKRLVEALGATFELRSKVGAGTVVTLRFPPELVGTSQPQGTHQPSPGQGVSVGQT